MQDKTQTSDLQRLLTPAGTVAPLRQKRLVTQKLPFSKSLTKNKSAQNNKTPPKTSTKSRVQESQGAFYRRPRRTWLCRDQLIRFVTHKRLFRDKTSTSLRIQLNPKLNLFIRKTRGPTRQPKTTLQCSLPVTWHFGFIAFHSNQQKLLPTAKQFRRLYNLTLLRM